MSAAEFRLILQRPGVPEPMVVSLPGPTKLASTADHALAAAPLAEPVDPEAALCLAEPIRRHGHPPELLVFWSARGPRPLVNGLPALGVSLLRPRDRVSIPAADLLIFVSLFRDSPLQPLLPDECGRPCALCRTVFQPSSVAYHCLCGALLCSRSAGPQDAQPTSCAALASECPNCSRPVSLSGGYEYWPEELDVP